MKTIFFRYFRMTALLLMASIIVVGLVTMSMVQSYQEQQQITLHNQRVDDLINAQVAPEIIEHIIGDETPIGGYSRLLFALARMLLFISLLTIIAAAVSAYYLSHRILAPLSDMREAVTQFTLGDFTARVPVRKNDAEMADLSSAFNTMATAMEKGEELRSGFIANVSHEMRTPMTSVLGYINGILDGTLPQDSATRYLGVIRDEMNRLSRLVQRMLDITRLQSETFEVHPRPTDLSELAAGILVSFETRINDKKLDVTVNLPDKAMCMADKDTIAQVCYNLMDNAIKFCKQGSRLELAVTERNDKVWLAVTNSGDEIEKNDLPFIFDRFYKTDPSRSKDPLGLGLGLHLVKTIINAHREQVYAESENGLTTFSFSLPAV